jgi:hypothetical protein
MVINHPGSIDRPLKVFIMTALIELELEFFHAIIVDCLDILCHEKKCVF